MWFVYDNYHPENLISEIICYLAKKHSSSNKNGTVILYQLKVKCKLTLKFQIELSFHVVQTIYILLHTYVGKVSKQIFQSGWNRKLE